LLAIEKEHGKYASFSKMKLLPPIDSCEKEAVFGQLPPPFKQSLLVAMSDFRTSGLEPSVVDSH
jgi:hypothetical protein